MQQAKLSNASHDSNVLDALYVHALPGGSYSVVAKLMDGSVDSPETDDFTRLVIHCRVLYM
jgi:hypothetical protein